MYNLQEEHSNISLDDIFSRISEYELWSYYCPNFTKLDKSFLSELYDDKNPSCRIFIGNNNRLQYKDFGTGDTYTILDYIQRKYNCNFKECLNIIANDFSLKKTGITLNKTVKTFNVEEKLLIRPKSRIEILSQPFNITDFNYWNQYKIPFDLLNEYNVFSCKHVYLYKGDDMTVFTYTKQRPIYAYRFCSNNEYSYKIYMPYNDKKYKWLFSGGSSKDIEGLDQLSLNGDTLILTKSLKDCMAYRLLGYDAISLQGEANKLEYDLVDKLLKRFDKIIVNYDNDTEGIKGSERFKSQYNFDYFFIDEYKDLSDYIMHKSLSEAKEMISNKLKQLNG